MDVHLKNAKYIVVLVQSHLQFSRDENIEIHYAVYSEGFHAECLLIQLSAVMFSLLVVDTFLPWDAAISHGCTERRLIKHFSQPQCCLVHS